MKAYLDNNVVSAIARNDHPSESAAISRLLQAYDDGRIELVTSEVTLDEIKEYNGTQRPQVEGCFDFSCQPPVFMTGRWQPGGSKQSATYCRGIRVTHAAQHGLQGAAQVLRALALIGSA